MSFLGSIIGAIPGVGDIAKGIWDAIDPIDMVTDSLGISSASRAHAQANEDQRNLLDRQEGFTQKMAEQTHQWNIEDWERQQEYNKPSAQLERMKAAGINPNASGGVAPSTASTAVTSDLPSTPSAPASNLGAMASLITAQSNAKLIDAQRKNIEADTKLKTNNARIAESDADWREDMNTLSYLGKKADIDFTKTKMMESDANRALAWKQATYVDKSMQLLDSNIELNNANIAKIVADKNVSEETARKIRLDNLMKTQTWDIQIDILMANLNMTRAQATNFLSQAALCSSQKEAVDLANDFATQTLHYRVETERHKMRKASTDVDIANEQKQLVYWNQNESRLNYQIDLETKQDLQYLGAFGTLIRCAGAVLK